MYTLKVSKRAVNFNDFIIGVEFCGMSYLLWYTQPFGYSVGRNGWECAYYQIKDGEYIDVIISTGYKPLSSKNTHVDVELLKKYEEEARAIVNSDMKFKASKAAVTELLSKFVRESRLNNDTICKL